MLRHPTIGQRVRYPHGRTVMIIVDLCDYNQVVVAWVNRRGKVMELEVPASFLVEAADVETDAAFRYRIMAIAPPGELTERAQIASGEELDALGVKVGLVRRRL